jgi:ribosomal protein S18 acetylase RimI-like enzyme
VRDVTDSALVAIDLVRGWYAEFGVPWGVRVPAGLSWPRARRLFRQRLLRLTPSWFAQAPTVAGLTVRAATASDLDDVLCVDSAAFEADSSVERPWVEPVGTAYALGSDGGAGLAAYLAGVAVLPDARSRGLASAMSARPWDQGKASASRSGRTR